MAASGIALLAETFAELFTAIRYAGAAYLLYLAWRLWTAPAVPAADAPPARPEKGVRLFLAGLAITLGNPKVIVFFLALLPTVLNLGALTLGGFAGIALLSAAILSGVLAAYTAVAARARRLLTSPRAVRAVNRGSGAAMAVPSTFPEAFGMVAAEAAACGALPVVADHSGLGEVARTLADLARPVADHDGRAPADGRRGGP